MGPLASAEDGLEPPQFLQPLRRQCFRLGNTEIYIRPSITLAEPTDLQKNFSKDKKTKSKQTRGTLAPESLPMGKIKAQSFWPSFPISSVFREKAGHVHTTSREKKQRQESSHDYFILKFITFGKSTVQGKTHWIK